MKKRRSSSSITLVLISATALSACEQQAPSNLQRDLYASQADCVQDWGSDASKCEPVVTETKDGTRRSSYTHYYGPVYDSYRTRAGSRSIGSTSTSRSGSYSSSSSSVSRSGFGSTSSSRSSSSGSRSSASSSS